MSLPAPSAGAATAEAAPHEPRPAGDQVPVRSVGRRLARAALMDVGPLRRRREFRLLFSAGAVSFLGSMITFVAVPYQVYALTGSSPLVGLLGACEFGPVLVLGLFGGALADSYDRRRLAFGTEALLAVASALLAVNAVLPRPALWPLFVLSAAIAALQALQRPSLDALLPRLVDRAELVAAGGLVSLRSTVGMIGGPALAGILIAAAGVGATYALDVGTFVVSIPLLAAMRPVPPAAGAEPVSLRRIVEGLRYARSRPELTGTYAVDFVAMFFGMPTALFPAFARDYGGPQVLGLLYAAPAAGAMLATVTSGWTGRVRRHGLAVLWAAGLWGGAVVGFGLARSLPLAVALLAAAGAADMVSGIFRMTIWNGTVPDALRGRLAGVEMISYTSGPLLGNAESGAAAALAGVRGATVAGGLACVVGVAATAVALPAFRRYRSSDPAGPVP